MKLFVSGCSGFLGSVMVGRFLEAGHQVIGYDNLKYKQSSLLQYFSNPNFSFEFGDVRQSKKMMSLAEKAGIIIPLAAIVGAPACDADPESAVAINHKHVKELCELGTPVVYPNSNSSYGRSEEICTEDTPMNPLSLYARTKCEAEYEVLNKGGISLRLATVFGVSPRPRLDLLVNDFTYKAMRDGYIVLFEKHFKRNYIHVRDVAEAFLFMAENYDKCKNQAYNIGLSSANLTKYQLALKIKEHIPSFSIQCDEIKQDFDKRDYFVSSERAEKAGWKPKYTLDDGISELRKSYTVLLHSQHLHNNA